MHTAHNTAYENIDTELNVCVDSDDYMPDNAVQLIIDCWNKNKNKGYAGIIALDLPIQQKSNWQRIANRQRKHNPYGVL